MTDPNMDWIDALLKARLLDMAKALEANSVKLRDTFNMATPGADAEVAEYRRIASLILA